MTRETPLNLKSSPSRLRIAGWGDEIAPGACWAIFDADAKDLLQRLTSTAKLPRFMAWLDGIDVALMPFEARRVGYVGSRDDLLPRKTVAQNVGAFHLPVAQVAWALELVGMIGLDRHEAGQLSAYDRRRVALARALAGQPRLLLLDDPLAGLPPASHMPMLRLLQKIRSQLPDLSLLLVSEWRQDVLMLADQVAVFDHGALLQQGAPRELYERPNHETVAALLGDVNLLPAQVVGFDGEVARLLLDGVKIEVEAMAPPGTQIGMHGRVAIRPERVAMAPASVAEAGDCSLTAKLHDQAFLGDAVLLRFVLADGKLLSVKRPSAAPNAGLAPGRNMSLAWQPGFARLLVPGLAWD